MQVLKVVSKRHSSLVLKLFVLLLVCVTSAMLMQPYILYRFATKAYVTYEINL